MITETYKTETDKANIIAEHLGKGLKLAKVKDHFDEKSVSFYELEEKIPEPKLSETAKLKKDIETLALRVATLESKISKDNKIEVKG